MSSIDNRIVDLKFNNQEFQAGAKGTLDSLKNLKNGLKFDGVGKAIGDMSGSIKKFSFGGMVQGVDSVIGRLNTMSVVGITAIANLTNKAVNFGVNMAKNFGQKMFSSAQAGLQEYEQKIGSIQTILANTAKHGTSLEEVTAVLDELNTYSDKTIYNFADMTRNIGLFTNAGIKVDDAASMIKGFSNEAAASGTTSQAAASAAYQLSQALSAGQIRLMDWRSLTNVGMGNKNMQSGIIEIAQAMGEFDKAGIDASAATQDFNGSLEKGWLSADVMSTYLKIMAGDMGAAEMASLGLSDEIIEGFEKQQKTAEEAATKVRTFTQLMDTLAEATGSGWAQSVEIVLGDFNEATALFSEISDIMGKFVSDSAEARNAQLRIWKDGGGREAVVDALRNAFKFVMSIVEPIRDAYKAVFPPKLGQTLLKISFALKEFTEGLSLGADGSEKIRDRATAFFKALKTGGAIFAGVIGFVVNTVKVLFELGAALVGLITPIFSVFGGIDDGAKKSTFSVENFFNTLNETVNAVLKPVIRSLHVLGGAIGALMEGDFEGFKRRVKAALTPLTTIGGRIKAAWGEAGDWIDTTFGPVIEGIRVAFGGLMVAINWVGKYLAPVWDVFKQFFSYVFDNLAQTGEKFSFEQFLSTLNLGLMVGMFLKVKKTIDTAADAIGGVAEAIGSLGETSEEAKGALKAGSLLMVAGAILAMAGAIYVLSKVDASNLVPATAAMAALLAMLTAAMKGLTMVMSASSVGEVIALGIALILFAAAVSTLAKAVKLLGDMNMWDMIQGLIAISVAMGLLIAAGKLLSANAGDMIKAGIALNIFVGALYLLAGVVAIFGIMPLDMITQGGIAVAGALVLLVGAAKLLSKNGKDILLASVGLMAMATALNMLLIPITALGYLPLPVLMQGFKALAILLGGLVIAALALRFAGPQMAIAAVGLMALAAALNMIIPAILILGITPWQTLVQGIIALAAVMLVLAVAARAMNGAAVGAAGMVAVAGAVLILAIALKVLASIDPERLGSALKSLAITLLVLAGALLVFGLLGPLATAAAAALALLGVGVLALSVGLLLMGPGLLSATAGLFAFSKVAGEILKSVPAMLAVGAGLIVFGIGAAVTAIGVGLLAIAFAGLGLGLGLLAVSGPIGVLALVGIVTTMAKLTEYIPDILKMGGALALLGAGTLILGAGLVVLAAGALLASLAILALAGAAAIMGVDLQTMLTTIINVIPMVFAAFGEGIAAFATVIGEKAPLIIGAVVALIESLLDAIITLVPKFFDTAVVFITGLLDAINEVAPKIIDTLTNVILALVDAIVILIPRFVEAGLEILLGIIRGIENNIQQIVEAALGVVEKFLNGIASKIGDVINAGFDVLIAVIDGIENNIQRAIDAGLDLALSVIEGLLDATAEFVDAGFELMIDFLNSLADTIDNRSDELRRAGGRVASAIVSGITGGLTDSIDSVVSSARNLASQAIEGIQGVFEINSPSKVTRRLARGLGEGLELGMGESERGVAASSTVLGGVAISAMKDALKGAKEAVEMDGDFQPTIKPVLDLSEVTVGAGKLSGILNGNRLNVNGSILAANRTSNGVNDSREEKSNGREVASFNFEQNNYSPKALSRADIYRQTKTLVSSVKEVKK